MPGADDNKPTESEGNSENNILENDTEEIEIVKEGNE